MSYLFISYSKHDTSFARHLKRLLEAEGFGVWMDESQIEPSTRWWPTIEQNIDGCAAFLVVMSPAAHESEWVEREILRAEKQRKPVFPVLLAGEEWSRLANIQYADMRAGLNARLPSHLLKALHNAVHRAPRVPTPQRITPPGGRARRASSGIKWLIGIVILAIAAVALAVALEIGPFDDGGDNTPDTVPTYDSGPGMGSGEGQVGP